ncbi:hypothetical protein TNCV_1070901 [Trichonephila clavipes]|nr:hypothetical protein TNCV_1070901 [Trichonephila clavipes]
MSRCSGQVISLMRKPLVLSYQASLVLIYRPTEEDEWLSQPCPFRGLNPGPVVWKRDAITTQPQGFDC